MPSEKDGATINEFSSAMNFSQQTLKKLNTQWLKNPI
jgi:hypothetical protein